MSKTLTISFVFVLGCFFALMPTNVEGRFAIADFEKSNLSQTGCYSKITKEEMELLLIDANPAVIKRLAEDAELKKKQIENLRELLATACQAVREKFTDDYTVKQELKNIVAESTAVTYDGEIRKNKDMTSPFGFITKEQVKAFWEGGSREAEFNEFFETKIKILKSGNPEMKDREISEEEKNQAKDFYAKTQIYKKEYEEKVVKGELPKEFQDKVALQVKLQTASFLSKLYSEKVLKEKTRVTEAEIKNHIAAHPEYDTKTQKAKAHMILQRIKAGENFAKLAKDFSEDPESKAKGGLYQKVTTGTFTPEFDQAALSLKAGETYPDIVETSYGFHIIKLEGKQQIKNNKGEMNWSYDVRHILILTAIKDPENPLSIPVPVKEYVKNKLEKEKQKKVLDEILLNNPVKIAEDFEIPKVSGEGV